MLTGTLGLFSILQLSSFNRSSEDIAEVWLPTTRALGDLNNYTSDFHAAENSIFNSELSKGASEELEFEALDRSIAQAQRDFESIPTQQSSKPCILNSANIGASTDLS